MSCLTRDVELEVSYVLFLSFVCNSFIEWSSGDSGRIEKVNNKLILCHREVYLIKFILYKTTEVGQIHSESLYLRLSFKCFFYRRPDFKRPLTQWIEYKEIGFQFVLGSESWIIFTNANNLSSWINYVMVSMLELGNNLQDNVNLIQFLQTL